MEEDNIVSTITFTPVETISNNNSTESLNDDIRLKNERVIQAEEKCRITFTNGTLTPKEIRYPRQMDKGINESIESKHKVKIKSNQVMNATPATENAIEDLNSKDQEHVQSIWDCEKAWNENNAFAREEIFVSILQNDDTKFSWANTFFYTLGIISASFSITIPYCIFPAHDIIKFPKYWYEILYHGFIFSFFDCMFWTFLCGAIMNIRHLTRFKTLSIACVGGIGAQFLFYISTYYSWTLVLCFNYPIPFFAYITSILSRMVNCAIMWLMIPWEWRSREEMKNRMKNFVVFLIATCVMIITQQVLIVTLRIFRGPFQPLIGLSFPVHKEISVWGLRKLANGCVNGDERRAMIEMMYAAMANNTICLSYVIGSIADDATSWLLMASDFLLNIYHCIKIVRTQKRNPSDLTNLMDLLEELSIAELVEFHSPITVTLVFSLAFYTPVGSLIGNVRNDYWSFEAVDDINDALTNMVLFFFVDLASTVVTYVVLRIYCNINCLKFIASIQKEFFRPFIVYLGFLTLAVNRNTLILIRFWFKFALLESTFH